MCNEVKIEIPSTSYLQRASQSIPEDLLIASFCYLAPRFDPKKIMVLFKACVTMRIDQIISCYTSVNLGLLISSKNAILKGKSVRQYNPVLKKLKSQLEKVILFKIYTIIHRETLHPHFEELHAKTVIIMNKMNATFNQKRKTFIQLQINNRLFWPKQVCLSIPSLVPLFVAIGADPNAPDFDCYCQSRPISSRTALFWVRNPSYAKALIRKGADVNSRDENGNTPLHMNWTFKMIKCLVDARADVNAVNRSGQTALHNLMWLHESETFPTARLLLAHGARVNYLNEDGRMSLDLAPTNECRELIRTAGGRAATLNERLCNNRMKKCCQATLLIALVVICFLGVVLGISFSKAKV